MECFFIKNSILFMAFLKRTINLSFMAIKISKIYMTIYFTNLKILN